MIRAGSKEPVHIAFCRAFDGASSEEKIGVLSSSHKKIFTKQKKSS